MWDCNEALFYGIQTGFNVSQGKFYLSLCSSVSVKKVAGKFILAVFCQKGIKYTIILVYFAGNAKSMENLQQTLNC